MGTVQLDRTKGVWHPLWQWRRILRRAEWFLPRGGSLPEDVRARRHRAIVLLMWVHVVAIPLFALVRGFTLAVGIVEAVPVACFAWLAALKRGRKFQSISSALGLLTSSAVLVQLSGGTIEMHFHFFVVIGVLTLYEDWVPFLTAIGFVLIHHGVMGSISPRSVYNSPAAWANPWIWSGIHAAFVLAASVVYLVAWRFNEDVRAQLAESAEQLRRSDRERRMLIEQVVRAREDEGKRISADLHDGPVQRLTGLDFNLERARLHAARSDEAVAEQIDQVQQRLRGEIGSLRKMMSALLPPALAERGLEAALHDRVDELRRATGMECEIDAHLTARPPANTELALFRVAQEALTNVARHAEASRVRLSLRGDNGSIVLEVSDDGTGFDLGQWADATGPDHFGLLAMRERVLMEGGKLDISSQPGGGGTRVRASFPREVEHS